MERIAPLFGTIALAAVLVVSIVGCSDPSGPSKDKDLTGTVSITPIGTVTVGTELTATYSGTETVSYQWYKDGTAIANATSVKYTPTAAGSYTVTVSAPGYELKTSAAVTVTGASGNDITYTVTQTGGADGTADTSGIVFTFSASVDSLGLTAADITVGGTAAKGTAALSGTGTTRTLAITVNAAGTATVAITKTGIEAGTKNVTVFKAGQTAPTLTGITAVYTGTATIYPTTPVNDLKAGLTVTAQYSNGTTQAVTNYTLSGPLTVGASTVTVSYEGKTTTFTVTVTAAGNPELPTPVAGDYTITGATTVTYDGTAKTVTVTANTGKSPGVVSVLYGTSQTAPINVGTYTVTFNVAAATGWNAANGLAAGTLTISPKVATLTVDAITAQTYTGSAHTPAVTVKDGTTTLTLTTDYTAAYSNNTNAGNATVTITGAGNYAGSSGSATFTISPKVTTFTVDAIPAQTYTGNAFTPVLTVKDGTTTLTLTTDYTVGYADNTNAGTATVTITGAGNYAGSSGSATFIINKAAGAALTAPTAANITTTSVTLNALTASTGQTVEYGMNTTNAAPSSWQAGTSFTGLTAVTTYYFFARSAANDNYETGAPDSAAIATKQHTSFTITFAQIADAALPITNDEPVIIHLDGDNGDTTAALTVTDPDQYSSIVWHINGITGSEASFTLNSADKGYNTIGEHIITLEAVKGGIPYNRAIAFTVAE